MDQDLKLYMDSLEREFCSVLHHITSEGLQLEDQRNHLETLRLFTSEVLGLLLAGCDRDITNAYLDLVKASQGEASVHIESVTLFKRLGVTSGGAV